jgi:transcriptional regulator with GAF, ATPase, and Fis domain
VRKLRIESGLGETYEFGGTLVTIGRSPSNMVVLADSRISSVHGEIVKRDDDFFYRDLGSTNGSLVRSGGREIVVDGRRVREVPIKDGDSLLLGDRKDPVLLQVTMPAVEVPEATAGTVVVKRGVTSVDKLGTLVLENPLASRQTLTHLFGYFSQLAETQTPRALAERLSQSMLDVLSKQIFAGCFMKGPEGLVRLALVTRDPAKTLIIDSEDFLEWFPDVFDGTSVMVVEVPPKARRRMGNLKVLSAVPLPGGDGALGAAIAGRKVNFSEFDLDLLSLLGHQAALQFQKLDLIEQLSQANLNLVSENRNLRDQIDSTLEERPMIGESPVWIHTLRSAEKVAGTDTTVLIVGATGTGKELIARYIHQLSKRRSGTFAAVNCGALAENLLESELFGHMKGSFTGADRDKIGLFQEADGGTLLLDEMGDVSPGLQVKLLRVLEAGEVMPVGATRPVSVDVRVLSATHKDLDQEVRAGRFREDLLYRINVFPIELPPLRKRHKDILLLAEHYLAHFNERLGKTVAGFDKPTRQKLLDYDWPGNVRELKNEVHRLVLLTDDGATIPAGICSRRILGVEQIPRSGGKLKQVMSGLEERFILRILAEHGDNRTHTAKALGISRQALTEKLRKYDIAPRHPKRSSS